MAIFWLLYWLCMLACLVCAIYAFVKKRSIFTLCYLLLSCVTPIWAFIFAFGRDYTSGISELDFLVSELRKGDIEAYLLLLSFLCLCFCMLYFLLRLRKQKTKY